MSRDFDIKFKLSTGEAFVFEMVDYKMAGKDRIEKLIHFPCTYEKAMKELPKNSMVLIRVEPDFAKGVKRFYVGKELPTKLVAGFPNRKSRFASMKDFLSSLANNSKELVTFESMRQRQFLDSKQSKALESFVSAASR